MGAEKPTIEVQTATSVTIHPPPIDNWRTLAVVGGFHSILLMWMAWEVFGPGWEFGCSVLVAVFEAWTLANRIKEDSFSEGIWIFSQRPVSVMIVCGCYFYALGQGWMGDPRTMLRGTMFGILLGHFYFSRDNRAFLTSTSALFGDRREVAR
jgi:hypothetical protein